MTHPIIILLVQLIDLYNFILFVWVILSLLIYFNIVNAYQPLVRKVMMVLDRLIEPALRPIRNKLPLVGGIDISPIILVFGLQFIRNMLIYYF